MKYDLEERTAKFAEAVIKLLKTIDVTAFNQRVIARLVGSAGSIGANYCEANERESKKDFYHKVMIAKKEAKESKHWLRLLASTNPELINKINPLWCEAHELLLIFSRISSSRKKPEN